MHFSDQKKIIEARSVTVRFGDDIVLDSISFDVTRGEFVGLVGPNGAGKSTLIKVALGLLQLTGGSCDIASNTSVSYVPQHYALPAHVPLSVREVICMGARNNFLDSDVHRALTHVGLSHDMLQKNFHTLSGGQKQRAVIARALVSNPDIIFFDEPLSGVDVKTKLHINQLLCDLNDDGMTIFFVSHDVEHVVSLCDRVLCLDRVLHKGCHPVDFVRGKRVDDSEGDVKTTCLVESDKKLMHHHHE